MISNWHKVKLVKSSSSNSATPLLKPQKHVDSLKIKECSKYAQEFESELNKAFNQFKKQLADLNQKRESIREDILSLRLQLKENSDEMETYKKNLEGLAKQKIRLNAKNQPEIARLLHRKRSIRDEIDRKQADFLLESEDLANEISSKNKLLQTLDAESIHVRQEVVALKEALAAHYVQLLKDGRDTRFEGLCWIVQKLWALSQRVSKNQFPNFLDENSINVILILAIKNKETEDILALSYHQKYSDSGQISERTYDRQTDKWNRIHSRLAQEATSLRIKQAVTTGINKKKS